MALFDENDFAINQDNSGSELVKALNFTPKQPVQQADTSGGVERVNKDSANTGAVAYRDSKGQVVLTNVAKNPITGKDEPIGGPAKSTLDATATDGSVPTFANLPDTRISLSVALENLRKAKTPEEASGIFASLQQSMAIERSRLETDAFKFAESKFGVPTMLSAVEAARQADRMDPLYKPGMGDSPITQRIVQQLTSINESARADATSYLKRNLSYNTLDSIKTQADFEMRRIERLTDKKETMTLSKELNATERDSRRKEQALFDYNKLSSTQATRVQTLIADQMENFTGTEDERRVKIAEVAFGNKDKHFQEAINAELPRQLLSLALQGNGYARKLLKAEESSKLGLSVQEVDGLITSLSQRLANPQMQTEVLAKSTKTPEEQAKIKAVMAAAGMGLDAGKKAEATQARMELLFQEMEGALQTKFETDVGNWRVPDVKLQAGITMAIDRAKKEGGKADIKSVAAAFLANGDPKLRVQNTQAFVNAMQMAADRYQDSAFGRPNWMAAKKQLVEEGVAQNWWTKALEWYMVDTDKEEADKAAGKIVNSGWNPGR